MERTGNTSYNDDSKISSSDLSTNMSLLPTQIRSAPQLAVNSCLKPTAYQNSPSVHVQHLMN